MARSRWLICICWILSLSSGGSVAGELEWRWKDVFAAEEKASLSDWLRLTHSAVERYMGPYPFPIVLEIHRRDESREPVPWANTRRVKPLVIRFYADPRFDQQAFLDDWTAPHEFAHLLLPYLGSEGSWFAEGFASYMQHPLMVELGVISRREALKRRGRKIDASVEALSDGNEPVLSRMQELKTVHAYPTLYWAGALYFERVDARLAAAGSSLRAVLRDYLACCRTRVRRQSVEALVAELDEVSGSTAFGEELRAMRHTPGIPPRPEALAPDASTVD